MFVVAITTILGLDHVRDTLYNAVCHEADREYPGQCICINYPFSVLRPFAPADRSLAPTGSVELDWQVAAERRAIAKLAQAKRERKFVIVNDLGHGIMQRAAFYREHGDLREAERLHHGEKVPQIVTPLGLGVPHYQRIFGTATQMQQAILACPGRNYRALESTLPGFVDVYAKESDRYFTFGQRRSDIHLSLAPPERIQLVMSSIRGLAHKHGIHRRAAA